MHKVTIAETRVIEAIKQRLKVQFATESSGHDWWHIYRVYQTACTISRDTKQSHSQFLVELGALLHDIADWKFHQGDETVGPKQAEFLLTQLGVEKTIIKKVQSIIKEISFKGAKVGTPMSSLEGKIVQDADRLDALGAIGIARAFAYGGHTGRLIYDPEIPATEHVSFEEYKKNHSNSINHFYEKLLLLKDRMNTRAGKKLAQKRHLYMEEYLKQFYAEWEGKQ